MSTPRDNNYEYLSNTSYTPMSSSYSYPNTSYQYSAYDPNYNNNLTKSNSFYKNKWDTPNNSYSNSQYDTLNNKYSNSQYSSQFKPNSTFSSQYNQYTNYTNVKKLPDQYSNLRQTFDSRGTNKIKDMISKYDNQYTDKNKYQSNNRYDNYQKNANFYGSKVESNNTKYRNIELEDKLKKYPSVYDQPAMQMESSSKMSEEIKKLKEDRRKRLQQAKQKQENNFMLASSYSSVNLGNSYKPTVTIPPKNYKNYQYNKYDAKPAYQSKQQNQAFKKKKNYQLEQTYTPKYQKKSYQYLSPDIALNKYKSKDYQLNTNQKYKNYTKQNLITSNSASLKATSPSLKKKIEPVQYIQINNFILGQSLGEGKFGIVYQAIHKPTGWLYAIKKIPKEMIKSHFMVDQFILELKLQTFLNHENILSIFTHFDDKTSIYLVLQYMEDGTLFTHLKKKKTLPQAEVASKIKQVASAVKYLHENQIAHRDIKPENIVMSHGVCKLCDFGWATICDERRKTYCGTFDYAPPQILQGVQYDYSVDLWCLGVLTYELLVGKAPFYHISRKQTMKKILNVQNTNIEYPEHLSKNTISFIDSLIKKDPKQRLSSQLLLEHPFLKYADKIPVNKQ